MLDHFVYDPATPAFRDTIYDDYRILRDHRPVHRTETGTFVLSRFEDVWHAVHDPATFSSDHVAEAAFQAPTMIYMDPPRHTALRALVSRAFTPKRVADLEPRLRQMAIEVLGHLGDEFDLARQYAAALPSMIMAELIGIPAEQRETFRTLTEAFLENLKPEDNEGRFERIYEMFDGLLAERRRAPQDDLMSALLAAEIDGVRLTDVELSGFCFLLLIAGNDTTTSLIGNGAELLARHPEQRAALAADVSLLPGAIEEMVRIESPTQALPRTAMRDVALHDITIPAGSRVMLLWGAANHDDREFPDPERFDIGRGATRHLGFGHGIHFCIGSSLARLEARVAFEELLRAMPSYTLPGGHERYVSNWARAWRTLPVRRT